MAVVHREAGGGGLMFTQIPEGFGFFRRGFPIVGIISVRGNSFGPSTRFESLLVS
jgi:hypothetical protein